MPNSLNLVTATIQDVYQALQDRRITSEELVLKYLSAMEANNEKGYGLRAVMERAPREILIDTARQRDHERSEGKSRGHLHGIPIIVKDSINVHSDMGMNTTSGTFALLNSRPKENAVVIQRLVDAGAIIIGKANMDVLSHFLDPLHPGGWSPRGGQCVSAFGPDHNVSGSSCGSAVAVSAGFCTASLGVEQCGSINQPAHCAGLYGLKPTPGLVPSSGVMMVSTRQESVGPIAKSPWDLAAMLTAMADGAIDYIRAVESSSTMPLNQSRLGVIGDEIDCTRGIDLSDTKLRVECKEVYEMVMRTLNYAIKIDPIHCEALYSFVRDERNFGWNENGRWTGLRESLACMYEMASNVDAHLEQLEDCNIKTIEDLARWNDEHPGKAFHPSRINAPMRQKWLNGAIRLRHADRSQYLDILDAADAARRDIIDYMDRNNLDLLVVKAGACRKWYPCVGAITRLPVATMPIGQLSDGSNIALHLVARPNDEKTLLSFMSATAKLMPRRPMSAQMSELQESELHLVDVHTG